MSIEMETLVVRTVPIEPIESQYFNDRSENNIVDARTVVKFMTGNSSGYLTGTNFYQYISWLGLKAPVWMESYIPNVNHVPPTGAFACVIYRLMVEKTLPLAKELHDANISGKN